MDRGGVPGDPRVHVIGVEPGAAALPRAAVEAARGCRLLAGARRHLELVPGFAGETVALEGGVGDVVERIAADPGMTAALLASGDPGFFGIGALVLRRLPREAVRLWPAVSSMQLAFARAREPWSGARFASLHARPLETLAPLLGSPRIGLFTDPENHPGRIARFVLDAGWDDYEMVVAEDLGLPSERLRRGPPGAFLDWKGSDLNVVLLLRTGPDPRPLGPGLPDDAFLHKGGMLTKREVRASALGLLGLPREGVLWDVGAGSGSVSVEACLLAPGLRAFAVERDPAAVRCIRENRRRFRVAGLVPVHGEAPDALAALPDPHAVFVGGTGGCTTGILTACWARLRPGGSMVVAATLLETLAEVRAWAGPQGLDAAVSALAAWRSRPLAGRTRLAPTNPVFLVRMTKDRGKLR